MKPGDFVRARIKRHAVVRQGEFFVRENWRYRLTDVAEDGRVALDDPAADGLWDPSLFVVEG